MGGGRGVYIDRAYYIYIETQLEIDYTLWPILILNCLISVTRHFSKESAKKVVINSELYLTENYILRKRKLYKYGGRGLYMHDKNFYSSHSITLSSVDLSRPEDYGVVLHKIYIINNAT